MTDIREHTSGTLILVLGILSLVVCAPLGPVAWYLGNRTLDDMARQQGVIWTNHGLVRAGRVCGMITTGIMGFLLLGAALVFILVTFV